MTRERVYLYVIEREQGPVKVGISSKPWKRVSSIQIGCPFKVELLFLIQAQDRDHAVRHERSFHDVFEEQRLTGEWFKMEAEDAAEGLEDSIDIERFFREKKYHEETFRKKMQ